MNYGLNPNVKYGLFDSNLYNCTYVFHNVLTVSSFLASLPFQLSSYELDFLGVVNFPDRNSSGFHGCRY